MSRRITSDTAAEEIPPMEYEDVPPEEYEDGDMLLEEEMGGDVEEDQFGQMLAQMAGAICSGRPQEGQETCYANFESLQSNIGGVAQQLGITLEDTKSALMTCAPCMTVEGRDQGACSVQPLLETYQNESTCGDFIAQLFPDLE